ncbi:MAG: methyltransferase domain-containing protein [Bacteriovoracia bacterium]
METMSENTKKEVQEYYGKVLATNKDLKTNACCLADSVPHYQKAYLSRIHEEVLEKFYGCGSPIPHALEGKSVLDLGSGSGRDSFLIAALAGPTGRVIGVDMTDEQLAVAEKHRDYHVKQFGLKDACIQFKKGFIEDLKALDIPDESLDVVVSNCVINLSPNKEQVFREIFRVLKPGGELYFSDIFSTRRLPESFKSDSVLVGECLGSALYTEDFRRMMLKIGVSDFRIVKSSLVTINDPAIEARIGKTQFLSNTVRAFKMNLEDRCEDFGQVATYKGGIPYSEELFMLDDHHIFEKNRPMLVCGNTADMLSKSRYGKFFEVRGDKQSHFGLFDCAPIQGAAQVGIQAGACC